MIDEYDNAHHVVPNQLGRPGRTADAWMRSVDNCVMPCDACHKRVHQNERFRFGAVASPDDFPYTHGRRRIDRDQWLQRIRDSFWGQS